MQSNMMPTKSTHSDKLERWLGAEQVNQLSIQFKDFYWPIPVKGIPGNVFIMPGGDFAGEIQVGSYFNKHDAAAATIKKLQLKAELKAKYNKALNTLVDIIRAENRAILSVGAFASIDAVIAANTGGKGQQMPFQKTGIAAAAIGNANDLWNRAGFPAAGGAGSAAPGGVAPTSATTGALPFKNLGTANTGHYFNWSVSASVINNSLLLYDRLFAVVKTMNSAATEAVTGLPSRYQNTTAGAVDYIGGNFCFPMNPTTVLAATAHNHTVCTYLDETNAAGTFPSIGGLVSCAVGAIDLAVGNWFMPLAAGDVGVKGITQMQTSAAILTGTLDFVIGHPIEINACPIANIACLDDGLISGRLTSILDNACLSFIELPKSATTATNYSGLLRCVSE
jgi:hypothetical protein